MPELSKRRRLTAEEKLRILVLLEFKEQVAVIPMCTTQAENRPTPEMSEES